MAPLDKKLMRDFRRLWTQVLAIALVMASGVATLVIFRGAEASLSETRSAYYERYRFADIFASAVRAPESLERRIAAISGVAAVETRISKAVLLDLPGVNEPATGLTISLPDFRPAKLNRLLMRAGRTPEPRARSQVVINERFAKAHGFAVGSQFQAILNGRKRTLTVVGIAMSPEYIYVQGPGDIIPDDRRFGILWMSHTALAAIFDQEGAFNSVSLSLLHGANKLDIMDALDGLLKPYGGVDSIPRKDQTSHAFLDAEINQMQVMSKFLPPFFLLVTAFLVNMTLMRLVALEREQIGLLKALGYRSAAVAGHYLKFALAIAVLGIGIGCVAGTYLGRAMTNLYGDLFNFPFLIFRQDPEIYLVAALISFIAAAIGGGRAVANVVALSPAVAMAPPMPPRFSRSRIEAIGALLRFSQLAMMVLRNLIRWPARAAVTTLGMALAVALLVGSFFSLDSMEVMIDVTFFQAERQDATLVFGNERPGRALQAVEKLPGVLRAEPFRTVPVTVRNGHLKRKVAIFGLPPETDLSRILTENYRPVALAREGLALSEGLASRLGLKAGDMATVDILDGRRQTVQVRVAQLIKGFIGLTAYMDLSALNRMLDEGPVITGTHISIDDNATEPLFGAVKNMPAIQSIALQKKSLVKFRETIAESMGSMVFVFVGLGVIVAFGVVYNSARVQLSERARELASLRVFGFTAAEVSRVLLYELAILTVLALPLGWALGTLLAYGMVQGFDTDIYRIPFVVAPRTYGLAASVVLASSLVSGLIVRRLIARLNLISALKTRE